MALRNPERPTMAWQASLADMKANGTRLAQCCTAPGCGCWNPLSVDAMIATHGGAWSPWGRRPECVRCHSLGHYMASPGAATPYRPLLPGPAAEAARKAFLKSFGFTRRDVARIKALAERVAAGAGGLPGLNDLDVPYRVAAVPPAEVTRSSGEYLGDWKDQVLLFWKLTEPELRVWRARPRAVKGI
jgi:hypothetical protein